LTISAKRLQKLFDYLQLGRPDHVPEDLARSGFLTVPGVLAANATEGNGKAEYFLNSIEQIENGIDGIIFSGI
jgi:hypothetical protein